MAEQATTDKLDTEDRYADLATELEKHATRVKNPNDIYQERLSLLNRVAVFVTEHVGTMGISLSCWAGRSSGLPGIPPLRRGCGLIHRWLSSSGSSSRMYCRCS